MSAVWNGQDTVLNNFYGLSTNPYSKTLLAGQFGNWWYSVGNFEDFFDMQIGNSGNPAFLKSFVASKSELFICGKIINNFDNE